MPAPPPSLVFSPLSSMSLCMLHYHSHFRYSCNYLCYSSTFSIGRWWMLMNFTEFYSLFSQVCLYLPKIKHKMVSCHPLQHKQLLRDKPPFLIGRNHNFTFILSKGNNNYWPVTTNVLFFRKRQLNTDVTKYQWQTIKICKLRYVRRSFEIAPV